MMISRSLVIEHIHEIAQCSRCKALNLVNSIECATCLGNRDQFIDKDLDRKALKESLQKEIDAGRTDSIYL